EGDSEERDRVAGVHHIRAATVRIDVQSRPGRHLSGRLAADDPIRARDEDPLDRRLVHTLNQSPCDMQNRPSVWNGIPVPYVATVDELAQLIHGPGPARWAAFVAVAHTADESALALLQDSARSPDPNVRRIAVEAIGIHPQGAR